MNACSTHSPESSRLLWRYSAAEQFPHLRPAIIGCSCAISCASVRDGTWRGEILCRFESKMSFGPTPTQPRNSGAVGDPGFAG